MNTLRLLKVLTLPLKVFTLGYPISRVQRPMLMSEILMRFDVCLGLPFVIQWSLCVYRRMYPPMSCLQFKEKLERIFEPILPHQYHQNRVHVESISCFFNILWFCGFKAGTVKRATNWKRKTYFATLLQNELESAVTLFTCTHEKKLCKTGSKVGSKTFKISNQLVLQKCCKSSSTFFFSFIQRQKVSLCGTFFVIADSNLCDFSGFFHEPQK